MKKNRNHDSIGTLPAFPVAVCLLLLGLAGCASTPRPPAAVAAYEDGSSDPRRQQLLRVTESLLGAPYRIGGESPSGMDCSGLVQYAYGLVGIQVPRTAAEQYQSGRLLDTVQPGDLLFFSSNGSRISHVGIFVGGGEMIHASSSSRRVLRTKVNLPYWRKHWIGAASYL